MLKLLTLIAILTVSACTFDMKHDSPTDLSKLSQIESGLTTKQDVVILLGDDYEDITKNGDNIMKYQASSMMQTDLIYGMQASTTYVMIYIDNDIVQNLTYLDEGVESNCFPASGGASYCSDRFNNQEYIGEK